MSVIWHDLECGGYVEDLSLWRELACEHGDPILDVGAGTGRVTLDLARRGHQVVALDRDPTLLAELERRAAGLPVSTAVADARSFELEARVTLCLVPMQTIQLLGGPGPRRSFLDCARRHLGTNGVLAAAITDRLATYETVAGGPAPLPDMAELDGVLYSSAPTAIRAQDDGFVLERRRETVLADGARSSEQNSIRLDRLSAHQLEREALAAGFEVRPRERVRATADYVGSTVVVLGA